MQSVALPVVSALTAGALIIIQMLLIASVALSRRANKQSLGDGGNDAVMRASRRHGNFAENAAIFVASFALLEMLGAPQQLMEILCAIFVLGRVSHLIGLSLPNTVNVFRMLGIAATIGVGLFLGARLVMIALPHVQFLAL